MSRRDEIINAALQPLIDEHDLVPPDWAGEVCFDAAIDEVRKIADEIQEYFEPDCDDGLQGGQAYISAKALHEFLDSLTEEKK